MPNLLFCVGRAVAGVGIADVAAAVVSPNPLAIAGVVAKIAAAAWKDWRAEKKQDKLNADILAAARLSFEEAKREAVEIARQVTSDPQLRGHVERFVTLVPASIRASLRRPEDPSGTTLPAKFSVREPDDLVPLLPARFPRFKPGDAPPFLKGWRLVEQIGAGGFGEVWKAQHLRASNLVRAVKFGHGLDEAEQSLLNEGDVLNRLLADGQPDGVVRLLDVWADGDAVPWLQYEYVPGGDLSGVIHKWQRLPAAERVSRATDALAQLSATVGHFHSLRPFVVHRDLKPSNVLVANDGKLKVADFGIGAVSSRRMLSENSRGLSAGGLLASYLRGSHTPLYASPQQRAGSRTVDPRDDVHALGVIGFQMLTGQLDAAPGSDADHDLAASGAPAGLITLIKSCTARDPNRRPKDAGELHRRLGEVVRPPVVPLAKAPPPPLSPAAAKLIEGFFAPPPPVARPIPAAAAVPLSVASAVRRAKLVAAPPRPAAPKAAPVAPPARRTQPQGTTRRGCLGTMLLLGGGAAVAGWWWWPNLRHLTPWGAPDALPPTGPRLPGDGYTLSFGKNFEMKFAWCPPGSFVMGSWEKEGGTADELPARTVTLGKGFYTGVNEVTQRQWLAVMGGNPSGVTGDDLPVSNVTWADAKKFCTKLSERTGGKLAVRLPTEAEWEYACRAGTSSPYSFGHTAAADKYNGGGNSAPRPVGSFPPNPWGLYDTHGNVSEWCEDWYDAGFYATAPSTDPVCQSASWRTDPGKPPPLGTPSEQRVLRGGSWASPAADCRSARRAFLAPTTGTTGVGFRVVFTPAGQAEAPAPASMPPPGEAKR